MSYSKWCFNSTISAVTYFKIFNLSRIFQVFIFKFFNWFYFIYYFFSYAQEIRSGSFGKYTKPFRTPSDFQLSRITAPLILHYSTADKLADATDATRLISKLKNSMVYVQAIDEPKFNHIDFVWSENSASLIYSKILFYFEKYQ